MVALELIELIDQTMICMILVAVGANHFQAWIAAAAAQTELQVASAGPEQPAAATDPGENLVELVCHQPAHPDFVADLNVHLQVV